MAGCYVPVYTPALPMCIPPPYADPWQSSQRYFQQRIWLWVGKAGCETKSCSGVEFSTSGSSNTGPGKVSGTLETTYKWCESCLTFTKKWNTPGTEIAIEDQICQGLKLTFDTTFSPKTGKKSGKIKSAYKRECKNLGCDIDFAGPTIHGSAVFGYQSWLAGYQMTFDNAKSKLTSSYRTGGFQATHKYK